MVRRDSDNRQAIHRPELAAHFARGTGHAGETAIAAKKTLVADARQRIILAGDCATFLHFYKLVQAMLPGAVRHDAPGRFVDDLDFIVLDEVVRVALHKVQRRQRLAYQFFTLPTVRAYPSARRGELHES